MRCKYVDERNSQPLKTEPAFNLTRRVDGAGQHIAKIGNGNAREDERERARHTLSQIEGQSIEEERKRRDGVPRTEDLV